MTSIFHYTDTAGLLGILLSQSLFATDYRYLNDTTEAAAIRDLLLPILHSEISSITPKLIERKWLRKEYFDENGLGTDQMQADAVYRAFSRALDNVSPFFIASFCEHKTGSYEFENGLLSQWRGYAQSGGFAIEFEETELGTLMKAENDAYAYAKIKSDNVRYDNFDKLFKSEVYNGVAGEMIRTIFETRGIDTKEVTGAKNLDEVMIEFIECAPFLKNAAFHEENEYRIVASCIRQSKIPSDEERRPKEIKFRSKNSAIIPYINLFEDVDSDLPIKSIIVGPHPSQEKQAAALLMVLETEYLNANVRLSKIPYRGL